MESSSLIYLILLNSTFELTNGKKRNKKPVINMTIKKIKTLCPVTFCIFGKSEKLNNPSKKDSSLFLKGLNHVLHIRYWSLPAENPFW